MTSGFNQVWNFWRSVLVKKVDHRQEIIMFKTVGMQLSMVATSIDPSFWHDVDRSNYSGKALNPRHRPFGCDF